MMMTLRRTPTPVAPPDDPDPSLAPASERASWPDQAGGIASDVYLAVLTTLRAHVIAPIPDVPPEAPDDVRFRAHLRALRQTYRLATDRAPNYAAERDLLSLYAGAHPYVRLLIMELLLREWSAMTRQAVVAVNAARGHGTWLFDHELEEKTASDYGGSVI